VASFFGTQCVYGRDGKFDPTVKSATESRRFPIPLLMTWCHYIDHTKSELHTELFIFCCTGRQLSQENWSKSVVGLSGSLVVGNWYAYLLAGVWLT